MTHNEIQTLVDQFVRAWTAEDLDALLECYDEGAELISPLLHTVRGIEAIERSHQDLFLAFSNIATEVHDVVVDVENQQAVLVFTIHATQHGDFLGFAASGRRTPPTRHTSHLERKLTYPPGRLSIFGGSL